MPETLAAVIWIEKRLEVPVLKIIENHRRDQVLIAFLQLGGEHITLHAQESGRILRTHYSPEKPKGTWDDTRVAIARSLGFADPERHGKYLAHSPLFKFVNYDGYFVSGRRVDVSWPIDGRKYQDRPKLVIKSPT